VWCGGGGGGFFSTDNNTTPTKVVLSCFGLLVGLWQVQYNNNSTKLAQRRLSWLKSTELHATTMLLLSTYDYKSKKLPHSSKMRST
jgi:hypothetical protein